MKIDIKKLTTQEKLRMMESLWEELSKNQEEYPSPDWHRKVLDDREQAVREGKDGFVDWDKAKKNISDSIS